MPTAADCSANDDDIRGAIRALGNAGEFVGDEHAIADEVPVIVAGKGRTRSPGRVGIGPHDSLVRGDLMVLADAVRPIRARRRLKVGKARGRTFPDRQHHAGQVGAVVNIQQIEFGVQISLFQEREDPHPPVGLLRKPSRLQAGGRKEGQVLIGMCRAMPIYFRLVAHFARLAASRTFCHRRQQQPDQDADDGDLQQLGQCETRTPPTRESGNMTEPLTKKMDQSEWRMRCSAAAVPLVRLRAD